MRRSVSSFQIEPARLSPNSWAMAMATLGLVLPLAWLATSTPSPAEIRRECQAVAGIASALAVRSVDPVIGDPATGQSCEAELIEAGVAVVRVGGRVSFSRPKLIDADTAVVDVSVFCGDLCGEGRRVVARRSEGRWKVHGATVTWIS